MTEGSEGETSNYNIGYGKTPVHSRFQKGVSGNPKGRPRGRKSVWAALRAAGSKKVNVLEGSRTRKRPKIDVLAEGALNRALKGDWALALKILQFMWRAEEGQQLAEKAQSAVVDQFIQHLAQNSAGGLHRAMTDEQLEKIRAVLTPLIVKPDLPPVTAEEAARRYLEFIRPQTPGS